MKKAQQKTKLYWDIQGNGYLNGLKSELFSDFHMGYKEGGICIQDESR